MKKLHELIWLLLGLAVIASLALGEEVSTPGFFDLTRVAGNAWVEISKPGGTNSDIKLAEAVAWEIVRSQNKVIAGDVVLSEISGVVGGAGLSVSVKEWAQARTWMYQPNAEVFIGLDCGYRPEDKCWLAGAYGSLKF